MDARELLDEMTAAGFVISAQSEKLVVRPWSRLTDEMLVALRQAKGDLLVLLSEPATTVGVESIRVAGRRCTTCGHLSRVRTCLQPIRAGLIPEQDGFGLAWPEAARAETCVAWVPGPRGSAEVNVPSPRRESHFPKRLPE
jgi:hypothetical protein